MLGILDVTRVPVEALDCGATERGGVLEVLTFGLCGQLFNFEIRLQLLTWQSG